MRQQTLMLMFNERYESITFCQSIIVSVEMGNQLKIKRKKVKLASIEKLNKRLLFMMNVQGLQSHHKWLKRIDELSQIIFIKEWMDTKVLSQSILKEDCALLVYLCIYLHKIFNKQEYKNNDRMRE